jgi:hypothetical protein
MRIKISIFSFVLCIIFCNNANVAGKEYFTVVSNRLIKPNKPYHVAVKYQGYGTEQILQVGLKNSNFSDYRNLTLIGDGDVTVEFLVSIKNNVQHVNAQDQ